MATLGTPPDRMKSMYWPGGAMLAVGGATQETLEAPAAEQFSTTERESKWTPCVAGAGRMRTTLSIDDTLEKPMLRVPL